MDQINAVTFGFMARRGEWETETCKSSLKIMKKRCGATHVILPIVVTQKTPQSTVIDWQAETVRSDPTDSLCQRHRSICDFKTNGQCR